MPEHTPAREAYAMADVAGKPVTRRVAMARGTISIGEAAYEMLEQGGLPKGDPLTLAEFAGIQAAKQTPALIPLCHPISLNRVSIRCRPRRDGFAVDVYAIAEIDATTGVEMEALCGANIALLTIWDLVKPVNAALEIGAIRLLYKSGGKRGEWVHPEGLDDHDRAVLEAF